MAYCCTTFTAAKPTPIRHSHGGASKQVRRDFFVTLKTATPGLRKQGLGLRFFSPTLHTWISMDPVGEVAALPLYGFSLNSPPNWIDVLGNMATPCCCCCCVDDLTIDYQGIFRGPYYPPLETHYGHKFDVVVTLSYIISRINTDCRMYWIERDIPGTWAPAPDDSPTVLPWGKRNKPCPGSETVRLPDNPAVTLINPRAPPSRTRHIEIRVRVLSGRGCPCKKSEVTLYMSQKLVVKNRKGEEATLSWTVQ